MRPLILLATNRRLLQSAALAAHLAGHDRQRWLLGQENATACRIYRPERCEFLQKHTLASENLELEGQLRGLARDLPEAVVVPTCIETTAFCSRSSAWLRHLGLTSLPVPSPESFACLNNKASFAALLHTLGVPQPETHLLESSANLTTTLNVCPTEAYFLKACAMEGGIGVERLENPHRQADHIRQRLTREGRLLLQREVPGEDVDISILADRGRIVAHLCQRTLDEGGLDFRPIPGLLEGAEKICAATAFHGLAHFDARRTPSGEIAFLECNPRVWNSIGKAATAGLNFLELALAQASGEAPASGATMLGADAYVPRGWTQQAFARRGVGPRRVARALIQQASVALRRPGLLARMFYAHLRGEL